MQSLLCGANIACELFRLIPDHIYFGILVFTFSEVKKSFLSSCNNCCQFFRICVILHPLYDVMRAHSPLHFSFRASFALSLDCVRFDIRKGAVSKEALSLGIRSDRKCRHNKAVFNVRSFNVLIVRSGKFLVMSRSLIWTKATRGQDTTTTYDLEEVFTASSSYTDCKWTLSHEKKVHSVSWLCNRAYQMSSDKASITCRKWDSLGSSSAIFGCFLPIRMACSWFS